MIIFLIKLSLCWGFFALFYRLLLRQETFFRANRIYLLGTLLLGVALAAIPGEQMPVPVQESGQPFLVMPALTNGLSQVTMPDESFQHIDYLLFMYWIGVLAAFSRLLFGLMRLSIMFRQGRVERLSDGTSLVHMANLDTPFSFFGWIFIPDLQEQSKLSENQGFNSMLIHEKAHAHSFHSFDILISELICIIFWFHPLAYWYKSALRAVHEYQADALASRHSNIKQYGLLLIRQSQSGMPIAFANHFFQSPLKQRLIMLTKKTSSPLRAFKFSLAFPLAIFLAFFFRQAPVIAQQNEAGPASKSVNAEPDFPGGNEALMQYLTQNIQYPESARALKAEGLVVVSFVVQKDGSLTDIQEMKTRKENHPDLVTEAKRVIALMPKWKPAITKGQIVESKYTLPIRFKLDQEDVVEYQDAEKKPLFPEGELAMMQFISTHLKYPEVARKEKVSGMEVMQFIVEKDGSLSSFVSLRSLHPALKEEAIRVLKLMPKFSPGTNGGVPVRVRYVLPVRFKLS